MEGKLLSVIHEIPVPIIWKRFCITVIKLLVQGVRRTGPSQEILFLQSPGDIYATVPFILLFLAFVPIIRAQLQICDRQDSTSVLLPTINFVFH